MTRWTGEPLAFNNQTAVPEHERLSRHWADSSVYVRKHMACTTDISYGPHLREKLDVFPAPAANAPVLIFIHGGWFQFLDKSALSYVAPPYVQQGITVVTIGYPLTPQATIGEILESARRAVLWVYNNIAQFGGDPARISIAGHSAGGHLALSMGVRDWSADAGIPDVIKGCFPISGLYDLQPVTETIYNAAIRLDLASAHKWSPLNNFERAPARLIATLGGDEISGFHWQHQELLKHCEANGIAITDAEAPGRNHYTIVDEFCSARSRLFKLVAAACHIA